MLSSKYVAGLIAGLSLVLGGCASGAARDDVHLTFGAETASGQEAADGKIADAAQQSFGDRGFAGLAPHLAGLRAALARAPANYPMIDRLPNGDVLVRADDMTDGILLMAAAMTDEAGKKHNASQVANVYPVIALLLGSEAVERKAFSEALGYLDRGLSIQPGNWLLTSEKIVALQGQEKWNEALALADRTLASDDLVLVMHKGVFHRRRGFALIELNRLDEAQAAYEEALKEEPDSQVAKDELVYIKRLKSGAAPVAPNYVAPGAKGSQQ